MKRKVRWDRVAQLISIIVLIIVSVINVFQNVSNDEIKASEYIPKEVEIVVYEDVITYEPEFIGMYKLTGYCACSICCGDYADGITYTGTQATEGRTIAVDPNKIPLGSKVLINGNIYIAEDVGGAIKENRIDIYKDNHSACFTEDCNGYAEVYLVND